MAVERVSDSPKAVQAAMAGNRPIVSFRKVDIVFGNRPEMVLERIDLGDSKDKIQEETGQILGTAGVEFDVEDGEFLVLMGLSGSGKSTLLRAVNGLNRVSRGEVLVRAGEAWINPSQCKSPILRQLRRHHIAMVFQQFSLLPWRSVYDNVALALELAGTNAAERTERVERQLDLVGLGGWRDKAVHQLSGGMQQRVGLARAFVTEAPILLMDEPFSALDPLIRTHMQDELLDLCKKMRRTVIFVSHDLDEAAKLGNRIVIMQDGRAIQSGTPAQIFRSPANDYVAQFVSHINPLNVLCARDILAEKGQEGVFEKVAEGQSILCNLDTPLRQITQMLQQKDRLQIYDKQNNVIGSITAPDILPFLGATTKRSAPGNSP